jgi:hypothetical protein
VKPGARAESEGPPRVAVQGLSEGAQVLSGAVGAVREGVAVQMPATAASAAR